MADPDDSAIKWRKSSQSNAGNCVEIASLDDAVLVRDSQHPNDGVLRLSPAMFRQFIARLLLDTFTSPDR